MSKIRIYENLSFVTGNGKRTGSKTSLKVIGKDKIARNVESCECGGSY